jgi:hypothetical protein
MTREYFVGMTTQEFEKALTEVVTLISNKPWFYFVNRPQGFKITRYWELITDQLSWLSEFMRTAYCDSTTTKIYLPTEQDEEDFWKALLASSFQHAKNSSQPVKKKLDEYLVAHNMMVFYAFYALTFDYWIKLFNEAILTKSVKVATYYLDQLEYALEQLMRRPQTPTSEYAAEKLQHSTYEADYQEHISTAKAVLEMLKQREAAAGATSLFAAYEPAG